RGRVEFVRIMFRHYDEIQPVPVRGVDEFVERSVAVAAERRMRVDDAFHLTKCRNRCGCSRVLERGDPIRKPSDLVPPINERNLKRDDRDDKTDDDPLYYFHQLS